MADDTQCKGDLNKIEIAEQANVKQAAARVGKDKEAARLCNDYGNTAVSVMSLRLGARERIRWSEDGLRAARTLGDRSGDGKWLGNLGAAYRKLGEKGKARECWEKALAAYEGTESPVVERIKRLLRELDSSG